MNSRALKLVMLLSSFLSINNIYAYDEGSVDPYYIGLEVRKSQVQGRGDWDRIFNKTYLGPGFFFGGRFCGLFHLNYSLEIGYNWTVTVPKRTLIAPGEVFLGVPNPSGTTIRATGKLRLKTGYLDLNAYIPLFFPHPFNCYYPEIILSVGAASSRGMIEVIPFRLGPVTGPDTLSSDLLYIQGRSKTTLRGGIGFQFQVGYYVGLRAMYRYESLSWLRPRPGANMNLYHRTNLLNDSHSISLGIYYTFLPF